MKILLALFSTLLLFNGCASTNSRAIASDSNGGTYACTGLGNNATAQVIVDGNQMKFNNAGRVQVGVKEAGTDPTQSSYSHFAPAGFIGADDTFNVSQTLLSTGTGSVDWLPEGVNIHWPGECHVWSSADSQVNSCSSAVQAMDPVAGNAKASVSVLKDNSSYELRIPSKRAGDDFVYKVSTQKTGDFCNVISELIPMSCPAVIANQISIRARKDGSSSGQPFVQKVSSASYTSGIHDAESGDFIYSVTVVQEGKSCKIDSIAQKNTN